MTEPRPSTLIRAVLFAHGVITLAGAVVLTVWPRVIPAAVGITVEPRDFLLVYLVGAAELAVAVLSFGATRLADGAAIRLVVVTLAVMHGASGLLNVLYMAQNGWSAVLVANTGARFVAVLVLVGAWRFSVRRVHQT